MTLHLPKAELHVHLEGSASPDLIRHIAKRNGVNLAQNLFNAQGQFAWTDFSEFLTAYDLAASVIRDPKDYFDITYQYLKQSSAQGVIYTEMMFSPDHAASCGLSYIATVEAIHQACQQAEQDFAIIGRAISTCVRHFGVDKAQKVAEITANNPHPVVVGFGMGGDELNFPPSKFAKTYDIAAEAKLGLTTHAGEWDTPNQIRDALDQLGVTRLGHGVRAAEDPTLVKQLNTDNIHLEVCPTSNIALKVFPDYASHPLLEFHQAGLSLSLNSDDPPYFNSTIGGEYQIAQDQFGLSEADLVCITREAIKQSFADAETKQALLAQI